MKALYRRYRPQKLEDVVGQEQVTEPLSKALAAGKINHAYLFVGPRGTGKTSVARILAHAVNGFEYNIEDDYVDIIEIDGASNRGIDNIRELREKVAIAPSNGKYKVYIIDEVHMLTKEAFNALLKTLEEPPKHVIFIMATTDAYKVPVTITSRSQVYTFKLAEPHVMQAHLKKICETEGIKISDDALDAIVKRGGGSYRDTLSILDQISTLSDGEILRDDVVKALGLATDEKLDKLLVDYLTYNMGVVASDLKEIYATGVEAKTLAEELINRIVENPEPQYLALLSKLTEVKTPYAEARLFVAMCEGMVGTRQMPVVAKTTLPRDAVNGSSTESASGPLRAINTPSVSTMNVAPIASFDWQGFVDKVHSMNDAIYAQLFDAAHEVSGGALYIYPTKKIAKTILSSANNLKVLMDAAGMEVKIGDPLGNNSAENDPLLSKISDIMGGEVRNDAGGNPF